MAQNAINNLNSHTPVNATEPIYVKYADEEGKKRNAPRNHLLQQHDGHNFQLPNAFNNNFQVEQNYGKMKRGFNQNRFNPIGHYSNNNQLFNGSFDNNSQFQQFSNYGQQNSLYNQPTNGGAHRSLYVYGIGQTANESDLYTLFSNVGRVARVNVIKDQKTGIGKGYGFVEFESNNEACYAIQQMNGYVFQNRPLQVSLKEND